MGGYERHHGGTNRISDEAFSFAYPGIVYYIVTIVYVDVVKGQPPVVTLYFVRI